MWLSEDTLAVEYADETLAFYKIKYQPDHKHLIDVADPQVFQTQHHTQQLHLWELDDAEWLKVFRPPDYTRRRKSMALGNDIELCIFTF